MLDGIHLIWMPPKSPELQPAERLWPLIANRTFDRNFNIFKTII